MTNRGDVVIPDHANVDFSKGTLNGVIGKMCAKSVYVKF